MRILDLFRRKSITNFVKAQDLTFYPYASNLPQWIQLKENIDYYTAYFQVPILNAAINYGAEIFQKCKIEHVKKDRQGNYIKIENSDLNELFLKPNITQNISEFLEQYWIFKKVFGYNIVYNVKPVGFSFPDKIYNLPIHLLEIKFNNKNIYNAKDINELIAYIQQKSDTNTPAFKFEANDLIFINDSNIDYTNKRYVLGDSKLKALMYPLTNIIKSDTAKNTFLINRGMMGVISNDSGAEMGGLPAPLEAEDKKELHDNLKQYGMQPDQVPLWITNAKVKYQKIGYNYNELGFETAKAQDINDILNAFGLSKLFFNSTEGSTFNNVGELRKNYIINTMIPEWETLEFMLNSSFQLGENEKIVVKFDFIPELQVDKTAEIERKAKETQIILDINRAVSNNELSVEAAKNILIQIHQIDEKIVDNLISEQNERTIIQENPE